MSDLWTSLIEFLGTVLRFFHELAEPAAGAYSWGVAIILLTVAVRVVLLPLAVKQINSMRAMQTLQPEIKKIQKKYKTDRSQMRTDPEKYRAQRQKQQEEMMALYKEHNVNPASGCLPLLAQAPVFFALFSLLRSETVIPELDSAGFFLVERLSALGSSPAARPGSLLLLVLMAVTTYVSQKQTMARMSTAEIQPQQKMMLYIMPLMLPVFGWNLPVGVLLYWVTTNVWTMAQQWFMFRNLADQDKDADGSGPGKGKAGPAPRQRTPKPPAATDNGDKGGKGKGKGPGGGDGTPRGNGRAQSGGTRRSRATGNGRASKRGSTENARAKGGRGPRDEEERG